MEKRREKTPFDLTSASVFLLGEVLGRTWRFSMTGRSDLDPFHDCGKGRMYAFWHSHLLPLAFCFRNTGKTAVISQSRDGARAAAVARLWGHAVIHGSSSRGGPLALRRCVRELRHGSTIVITPDGPRGPRETVKKGVAQIALMAGACIVPVKALPERAWRLNSWDRFLIPKPFSRVEIRLGEPLLPEIDKEEDTPAEHLTARLQEALSQ